MTTYFKVDNVLVTGVKMAYFKRPFLGRWDTIVGAVANADSEFCTFCHPLLFANMETVQEVKNLNGGIDKRVVNFLAMADVIKANTCEEVIQIPTKEFLVYSNKELIDFDGDLSRFVRGSPLPVLEPTKKIMDMYCQHYPQYNQINLAPVERVPCPEGAILSFG